MLQRVPPSLQAHAPSGSSAPTLDTVRIADLPGLDRDAIHDLWRRLHRKPPPKGLTGDLLVRALAYRIQIERHGGLSRRAQQRLATAARQVMQERARAGQADGDERAGGSAASRTLRPGTRLVREWQGDVHEVIALADGFLWNGAGYRSLSVIAKAITGTSWNGWIFFGVERKKPRGGSASRSMPVEDPLKVPGATVPAGPVAMLGPTAEHPELPPRSRPVRKQSVPPASTPVVSVQPTPILSTPAETTAGPLSDSLLKPPTTSRARTVRPGPSAPSTHPLSPSQSGGS